MDLLRRFRAYIQQHDLFQTKDHLLLAVSGGVDSVTLCELCRQAGYPFTIAHCNFQLRGEESLRDEEFVKSLAARYGVGILIQRFETGAYAQSRKCSIQVAARELRYTWFKEILEAPASPGKTMPTRIVTAHHADDNIETVLMNFFKGTGIAGLRGILPKHGNIVRPLLFATKDEIIQFAELSQLNWVEDSSNAKDTYSRNYIRHKLLPVIREIYPQAESNLAGGIERFRDIESIYRDKVNEVTKKLVERKGDELHIPILKLEKTNAPRAILYELIHPLGFTSAQIEEVMHLLQSETGRYIVSQTHRVLKNRNWLIIAPLASQQISHVIIESGTDNISFPGGGLTLRTTGQAIGQPRHELPASNPCVAHLDARDISFPLMLRKWKPGDYFYPLGMRKKKKLARFFVDQKLSAIDKEKAWVLEMDKKIIWVIGMRIDDRFRITDGTREILEIKYTRDIT